MHSSYNLRLKKLKRELKMASCSEKEIKCFSISKVAVDVVVVFGFIYCCLYSSESVVNVLTWNLWIATVITIGAVYVPIDIRFTRCRATQCYFSAFLLGMALVYFGYIFLATVYVFAKIAFAAKVVED